MRRTTVQLTTLALALFASAASAQDSRPAIVVLPFANGGSYGQDKESFEALETGIQAVLLSELARNPAVRAVDRAATRRLLGDQAGGGRMDAATAAKAGELARARYTIFGSFVDLYGRFRLNARIVDVQSGAILKVVSNDDPKLQDRQHLHEIIRHVASRILEGTGVPALPNDGTSRSVIATDALTLYARGLVLEDRGERANAAEYYRKALEAAPEFTEAREGLRRTGA